MKKKDQIPASPPPEGNASDIFKKIFEPSDRSKSINESENVSMIIAEWLKKTHIKFKTRYTKKQVLAVTTLQSLSDTYKIKTLHRFLAEFRINKLSEDGKSSSELENILSARLPAIEENSLRKIEKYLE